MDFDTVRPIISGLVGASIAGWLALKLAKSFPHDDNSPKQQSLKDHYKRVIRVADIVSVVGFGSGLMLYMGGFMPSNDWRGFGIMMGLTALLPALVIIISNLRGGVTVIQEGFLAFALAHKTPPIVMFPAMGLMLAGGIFASVTMINPTMNKQNKSEMATPRKPSD